jgi:hypothetical protein
MPPSYIFSLIFRFITAAPRPFLFLSKKEKGLIFLDDFNRIWLLILDRRGARHLSLPRWQIYHFLIEEFSGYSPHSMGDLVNH